MFSPRAGSTVGSGSNSHIGSNLFTSIVLGVMITLSYLIDRVVAPRLDGLLVTLVFPLAVTTAWYLIALIPSAGTIFNPAYTQYGDLPLMQLVSVTVLWGIILLNWLASLVNWAWEQGFALPKVRPGLLLYSSLLALVFLGGGARLAFFAPQGATVRVAGITAEHVQDILPDANFAALLDEKTTETQRQAFRPLLTKVDENLLILSQQEAPAGAKDESVLIDPSRHTLSVYQKAHPVPGEEDLRLVPGN